MRNKVWKLLALALSMSMLLGACGQTADTDDKSEAVKTESSDAKEEEEATPEIDYPEYLNLDSAYPIIKDEYADDITLTVAFTVADGDVGEWDDLWISKYLSDKYNINLEVEYLTFGTRAERKNLMFAADELPDIIINGGMTTDELVKYGVEEGMFLQLDAYMNETLTPNILKYMEGDIKAACTATDGHIYTLP